MFYIFLFETSVQLFYTVSMFMRAKFVEIRIVHSMHIVIVGRIQKTIENPFSFYKEMDACAVS